MLRHPRILAAALSILALALVLLAGPAFASRSHARTVAVPRLRGDVNHAYAVLRHDGFRVSIAHPFTLRSDALTTVAGVSPKPGRRLQRGGVVTLRVRCCGRLVHPPALLKKPSATILPRMSGRTLGEAAGFVRSHQQRYRATVGALHAATAPALAGNYLVTQQSVPADGDLHDATALLLNARQGRPAVCVAPYFTQWTQRSRQAVLHVVLDESNPVVEFYDSCLRRQNVERLLVRENSADTINTSVSQTALAGTHMAAVIYNGASKGQGGPYTKDVVSWDLTTGKRTTVSDAGESQIAQLSLNAQGFVAWRTVTALFPGASLMGVACPATNFCAGSDTSGSVLTSGAPTGGRDAWADTQLPVSELSPIACPSVRLCVVAIGSELLASSSPAGAAATWQPIMLSADYTGVSCPSESLCVAVGGDSIAVSTDPTVASSWTVSHISATGLNQVACPSASLCVVSTNSGGIVTSTDPTGGGSTWSLTQVGDQNLTGIACGSTKLCVTGDGNGHIFTSTDPAGSAWSPGAIGTWSSGPISCASDTLCVAGIENGVLVSTDPTGPASAWSRVVLTSADYVNAVACVPGGGLCAAAIPGGSIATSTDPAGGAGTWTVAPIDVQPCVDSGGCDAESIMASDSSGVHALDSVGSGGGTQLQNLNLTGDNLTWTRNGASESATLR